MWASDMLAESVQWELALYCGMKYSWKTFDRNVDTDVRR